MLILGSYLSKDFLYKMTKQKQANENCSKLQRRVKWQKITTNYCSSLLVKICWNIKRQNNEKVIYSHLTWYCFFLFAKSNISIGIACAEDLCNHFYANYMFCLWLWGLKQLLNFWSAHSSQHNNNIILINVNLTMLAGCWISHALWDTYYSLWWMWFLMVFVWKSIFCKIPLCKSNQKIFTFGHICKVKYS